MLAQVVVGIDVDDLIERTELGVPESPQFGVFLPQRQPLGIALFKFGQGPGAKGIHTDFVDHRRIPAGDGAGGASDPSAHLNLIGLAGQVEMR
jgi:hypothetical protein